MVVVDVSNLLHRAFYVAEDVAHADRLFLSMLRKSGFTKSQGILCFDGGSKKRKEIDPSYKAHRIVNQDLNNFINNQYEKYREKYQCLKVLGFEADDLICTICTKYQDKNFVIVSSDHDLWSLVNKNTKILIPGKWTFVDEQTVYDKFGVYPCQMIDYKALTGDVSDGINGVSGIGKKRASQIIQEAWPHTEWWTETTPDSIKRLLQDKQEEFLFARSLVQMEDKVPLEIVIEEVGQKETFQQGSLF